jgi:hypothetical protein
VDLATAVILSLAALTTAWAGYQSSRWHGKQAESFAAASAARVESTRQSDVANRQAQIDVATFTEWVDAYALRRSELAAFYRRRFRPEFKPAFNAWIATRPVANPDAPLTPFAMPQYQLAAQKEADALEARAVRLSEQARNDIQRADNYVLAVVLLAASLFLAGISTRLPALGAQISVLALAAVIFLGTLVWLLTFPVTLAV